MGIVLALGFWAELAFGGMLLCVLFGILVRDQQRQSQLAVFAVLLLIIAVSFSIQEKMFKRSIAASAGESDKPFNESDPSTWPDHGTEDSR